MRLLVITQYYWPENFRINDLVAGCVEQGHTVTVLTGQPNYPSGSFPDGYGWRGPRFERVGGADVLRVPLIPRGNGGSVRLALNYLSFAIAACYGVLFRLPRDASFDAIFVFEPSPITVGIPGALARRRYQAPVLFWVLDLWPESLAAAGVTHSGIVLQGVDALARWVYRRCDLILVTSMAFVGSIVRHGPSEDRIRYFPNWGEPEFDRPVQSGDSPSLPSSFRVMFAGNVGAAQDFPAILDAATLLKDRTDIHWIIAGDGRLVRWAREEVSRRGLGHTVSFLGQHTSDKMPAFLAAADALLVTLRDHPTFASTIPGKLQTYLAAGKPILAMLAGEGARIINEAGAGFCCPSGDSAGLADAVERLSAASPEERARMGSAGRKYFEEHFSRQRAFERLEEMFREVASGRWKSSPLI